MIHAIGWFCPEHCGVLNPLGRSLTRPAPDLSLPAEAASLTGRPLKNHPRMTRETRQSLCAASLALQSPMPKLRHPKPDTAIIAAGYAGCLQADVDYFRDYVANGRICGRGNLFIYTLPTSAPGEIGIALGLTGPMLHIHADTNPAAALIRHASELIADGEADCVLALWSDLEASICFAIGAGASVAQASRLLPEFENPCLTPIQLAQRLRENVTRECERQP